MLLYNYPVPLSYSYSCITYILSVVLQIFCSWLITRSFLLFSSEYTNYFHFRKGIKYKNSFKLFFFISIILLSCRHIIMFIYLSECIVSWSLSVVECFFFHLFLLLNKIRFQNHYVKNNKRNFYQSWLCFWCEHISLYSEILFGVTRCANQTLRNTHLSEKQSQFYYINLLLFVVFFFFTSFLWIGVTCEIRIKIVLRIVYNISKELAFFINIMKFSSMHLLQKNKIEF